MNNERFTEDSYEISPSKVNIRRIDGQMYQI